MVEKLIKPYYPSCFCDKETYPKNDLNEKQDQIECLLKFPDTHNSNEFPRICPVHGIYSIWEKMDLIEPPKPLPKCDCLSQVNNPNRLVYNPFNVFSEKRSTLYRVTCSPWQAGNAADTKSNRLIGLKGESVSNCPRSPVIVNSHTHRAKFFCEKKLPYINMRETELGSVYSYLRDLKLEEEIHCLEWYQRINVYPDRLVNLGEVCHQEIEFDALNKRDFLFIRMKEGGSYTLSVLRNKFKNPPKIFFGDQILSLKLAKIPENMDVDFIPNTVKITLKRNPFLKWHKIRLRKCPHIEICEKCKCNEKFISLQDDLGIVIVNGEIVDVMHHSPASDSRMQCNTFIVEVNNRSTLTMNDFDLTDFIRYNISHSPDHAISIATVPSPLYRQLTENKYSRLKYVQPNRSTENLWKVTKPFRDIKS